MEADEEPPEWLDRFDLPGLKEAQRQIETIESQIESLDAELSQARREFLSADRFRRLLWQEGKFGLNLPVRDALALLGFRLFSSADEPAVMSYEGESVLVEVEASLNAAGMEPHYRLRERLEREIAQEAKRPHGLIVVNGYRDLPPNDRPQQFEDALRVAAESMRYCVVDTVQLFEAVQAQLEGKPEAAKAFAQALLSTEGALEPEPLASESTDRTK
jgi:hypothetical protein